ncbi:MAG: tetratricopeptide repeat protein [Flavisolibacter sp.]
MKMKKSAIFLSIAAFLSITTFAQNVQEGINDYYAERYQSAKSIFDKLIAANPNNMDAIYWSGQVALAKNDIAGAKSIYDKALAANGNAPLILAGRGEIDLIENRGAEARQRFESAITVSHGRKGNDPAILNAVARANIDAYTDSKKQGDLDYAITKLNESSQINPNNSETYLLLGNAYRKKRDGSLAVQNYRKAMQLNPSLAVAAYRTAMLFKTQTIYGTGPWDIVTENLNNAIAADPKFAPAYEQLYYYNLLYKKDFPTAESFANKYISSSDPSVENDYLKAQTAWVQNKFPEAISIAKNIIAQTNNNPNPRVYRLLGYSYLGSKDTAAACEAVNQFFTKVKEEEVVGQDYLLHATACGKNNPDIIRTDVIKAVQIDSDQKRQIIMLNEAIKNAHETGDRALESQLQEVSYKLRGSNANPAELFQIGLNSYLGGNYQRADSLFKAYASAFPDSIYGHYWSALALSRIDTTMEQGLVVPEFEKSLVIADKDKIRYKGQGLQAASTLAAYYNNIKKNRDSAIVYLKKGLEFDPTNASLQNFLKALETPVRQPTRTQSSSSGTKTKTGTKPKSSRGK